MKMREHFLFCFDKANLGKCIYRMTTVGKTVVCCHGKKAKPLFSGFAIVSIIYLFY
jgi:hypothetical protein